MPISAPSTSYILQSGNMRMLLVQAWYVLTCLRMQRLWNCVLTSEASLKL